MLKRIESILDNEYFEYTGDVEVTGSIGVNTTVVIKNGSLIVKGNVGDKAEIKLLPQSSTGFYVQSNQLTVMGNIGSQVDVKADIADFNVSGSVGRGSNFKSQSGSITAASFEDNVTFKTMSGHINVSTVGKNCSLKTVSGNINANTVDKNSSLNTMSGSVSVIQKDASAQLQTISGGIYINNQRQHSAPTQTRVVTTQTSSSQPLTQSQIASLSSLGTLFGSVGSISIGRIVTGHSASSTSHGGGYSFNSSTDSDSDSSDDQYSTRRYK